MTRDDAPNGIFNVGTGRSISVGDVVEAVMKVCGPRRVICRENARRNEIPDCVCDNRRFREAFDWEPEVTIEDGIRILMEGDSQKNPPDSDQYGRLSPRAARSTPAD